MVSFDKLFEGDHLYRIDPPALNYTLSPSQILIDVGVSDAIGAS